MPRTTRAAKRALEETDANPRVKAVRIGTGKEKASNDGQRVSGGKEVGDKGKKAGIVGNRGKRVGSAEKDNGRSTGRDIENKAESSKEGGGNNARVSRKAGTKEATSASATTTAKTKKVDNVSPHPAHTHPSHEPNLTPKPPDPPRRMDNLLPPRLGSLPLSFPLPRRPWQQQNLPTHPLKPLLQMH